MEVPELITQGNLTFVTGIDKRPPPVGGKRGTIKGFTPASRRRMIRLLLTMGEAVPTFLTVTYGKEWPPAPEHWKRDLHTFMKRIRRAYPDVSAIWRLEPQKRGAPHYHFLLYAPGGKAPFIPKGWIRDAWCEVSGDVSPEHLKAGTRIESIRDHRGGVFYGAKYCAKVTEEADLDPTWEKAGRLWGVHNRALLPQAPERRRLLHSEMEQRAVINVIGEAYKRAVIQRIAKGEECEETGVTPLMALQIAEVVYADQEAERGFKICPRSYMGDPAKLFDAIEVELRRINPPAALIRALEKSLAAA